MINQSLSLIHGTKAYTCKRKYLNKAIEFTIGCLQLLYMIMCADVL